jgi:hypothetical protein
MNVYIVSRGEHGEGHDAEVVFDNLPGAKQYVYERFDVVPVYRGPGVWMCHEGPVALVWIHRFPVRTRR